MSLRGAGIVGIAILQGAVFFACGVCEFMGSVDAAEGKERPSDANQRDLAKLQGTWTAVSVERDGQAIPKKDVTKFDLRLVIKGSDFMLMPFASKGPEHFPFGTFKLHVTKSPKAIDFAVKPYFPGMKASTELGIYEVDGDRLKMLRGRPGQERPAEFETKGKSGLEVIIFQRVNP